jgi:hypothetical protein
MWLNVTLPRLGMLDVFLDVEEKAVGGDLSEPDRRIARGFGLDMLLSRRVGIDVEAATVLGDQLDRFGISDDRPVRRGSRRGKVVLRGGHDWFFYSASCRRAVVFRESRGFHQRLIRSLSFMEEG